MDDALALTIDDLARLTELPVRTVRYYISEGLLPGPIGRGKSAVYTAEHLTRLRLIRRLVEQRTPLFEIRDRLAHLTPADVVALLDDLGANALELEEAAARSPRDYIATLLDQARQHRPGMRADVASPPLFDSPQPQAIEPSSERWERWELAPGVELHVRGELVDHYRDLINRVLTSARERARRRPPSSSGPTARPADGQKGHDP